LVSFVVIQEFDAKNVVRDFVYCLELTDLC
jgi:hypothetical protein